MYTQAVVAALVALPLFAQSAFATCARSYTIQAGDICDSISAAHNVSTYQLGVVNPGIDDTCSNLTPGQTICLGNTGEDCTTTYLVSPDDTCDQISIRHGINSTILYANNPQINSECTNIYVGEVLCVGGNVQVPPSPNTSILPGATIPVTAAPANPTVAHHQTNPVDDEDLPFCDEL